MGTMCMPTEFVKGVASLFDPALNAIAGEDPVIKRLIEEVDGELFKEGS